MEVNSLTFDGINSADYGIYISGSGAFSAPVRAYEMKSIPGRNGQIAIDQGYYDNIEVTYPAFVYDYDKYDFAERMMEIRSQFASRVGYCRLFDTYNPEEYRLGIFMNGVEVTPQHYNKTGEFNLVFNCKPQRYLVSGEVPVTVTSGDSITNPTLFDSHPLLLVDGYGEITVNGRTVSISDVPLGRMTLASNMDKSLASNTVSMSVTYDPSLLNANDVITVSGVNGYLTTYYKLYRSGVYYISDLTFTPDAGNSLPTTSESFFYPDRCGAFFMQSSDVTFSHGTASSYEAEYSIRIDTSVNGNVTVSTGSLSFTLAYDGIDTITLTQTVTTIGNFGIISNALELASIICDSSQGSLGEPLYLDLENGSAYKYENDTYISINSAVWLGTELPVLSPGVNNITFDNTVAELQIVPRWWTI